MRRKILIQLLSLTVLFLSLGEQAKASHAMGADLTYECLGGNTYKIRLSFYRDCIGISAPFNVYVNVRSTSCNQNLGLTCNPVPGTGQEVTYLCPTAQSTCNGGTFTGIQEYVYEGVITLPMQCTDWVFSYSLCCRNAAISTITSPGSSTFYIYATLDNLTAPCNSSPTFYNKPVPFACLGQQLCFNHGAVDAEGDSLVYSLVNPKQTVSSDVNYVAPYNSSNPLNSSPAMQFNSATGDICFTPQLLQVTVMAVLVREYRNGVLIGSVVRDIQVTVLNCSNNLPVLSGINGTSDFDLTVCANDSVCFNILSSDPDNMQALNLVWNQAIPAAAFSQSASTRPTGTFCWKPSQADISNTPYCFTVRVNDDACPYVGANTYSYCITVTGIDVNAGPDQNIACSDFATVTASAVGGSPPYSYLWSNGFTGPTQTVGPGTYIVTVSDGTCSGTDTVNLISAFEPVAGFSWTTGCLGSPTSFFDQTNTAGGLASWSWSFGDGSTSTQPNPQHTYSSPGTYTVSLVVENIYGCFDTLSQLVTILPLPVAAIGTGNGCMGTSIGLNDQSTPAGSISSWSWTTSNGMSSSQQDPGFIFGSPGTYTVNLTITDTLGCTDTVSAPVTIFPLPTVSFTTGSPNCENAPVTFNGSAGGTISSWSWNFGDGDSSTVQNPIHSFPTSGTYSVSLTVTDVNGCIASVTQPVTIATAPAAWAGPDQSVCLGSSVTLQGSGGVSYSWSPGGQTSSTITVSPSVNTGYAVTVTDANGCTATDTVQVTVLPLPVPVVSPDPSLCAGQSTTLTASGGVSYTWNPSGATGGSVTVSPSSSTTYAVNVTGANGCIATAFINVTVNQNPVLNLPSASFTCSGNSVILDPGAPGNTYIWSNGSTSSTISVSTPGTYTVTVTNPFGCSSTASTQLTVGGQLVNNNTTISICAGQSAVLDAGYPGNNYQWSTGATSQTISVNSAGTYLVTVTDANGCSGTIQNTVNVNPLPTASFTPFEVCIGQAFNFSSLASVIGDTLQSWQWNFGDGNVSYQQNPVHSYTSSGTYAVSLSVTTGSGCSVTFTDSVRVYPLPQANFAYNFACVGEPIPFIDQSNTGFGNIISWSWDFGDGTTSTVQNPAHAFPSAGTYNVTLTVSTAGGCSDTRTRLIHIYPLPSLSFTSTPATICAGGMVTLNNTSTSSNGAINSWYWNLGNGTTSTQVTPSVVYPSAGNYTISLIGVTSHGCSDTINQIVSVNPLPLANAGPDQSICQGQSVMLNASGGGNYLWSNGSTLASISVNPSVTTTYALTVTSAMGCVAYDSVRVTVRTLPLANAGADRQICAGGFVTLIATGGGTYSWNPGGSGGSALTVNPASTTQYVVLVTGSNGCQNTDTVRVTVNPIPVANAGPDQTICSGTTTTLTASGGGTYQWSHGASGANAYVNPSSATTYIVTVTSAAGCIARDTVRVNLSPSPVVSLTNAFFCTGNSATLDAGNPGSSYLWSPNGETTQSINVTSPGTYSVVVTNAFGCNSTASSQVSQGGTGITAAPVNQQACQGTPVLLDAGNPGSSYVWSTGASSQSITVNAAGNYQVTVTDLSGCSVTFSNQVIYNPLPSVSFTADSVCFGQGTQFINTSSISGGNISNWNWTFGNGYSSNLPNPVQTYGTAGTYPVSLIASSGFGCVDSASGIVVIHPNPIAQFTAADICQGNSLQFTNTSTVSTGSISSSTWSLGDGFYSNQFSPSHLYASQGTYLVSLAVISGYGCADTSTASVNINPKPQAGFTASDVCHGSPVAFQNQSIILNGSIGDYSWDFGDGQTSNDIQPLYQYANPGTYSVQLVAGSDLGCRDTFSMPVTIHARPQAIFSTQPVCEGDSAQFTDLSTTVSGAVNAWHWEFGDGAFSSVQNPAHGYQSSGTYPVQLVSTSTYGCRDTATASATVNDIPTAAFSTPVVCEGSPVTFTDLSTVATGSITQWEWSFGDGLVSTQQNPSHNYLQAGTYSVRLIVSSGNGCQDTLTQAVNVFPVPQADFFAAPVCDQDAMEFFDLSQISGGGSLAYSWNFGDGGTDTLNQPQHIYSAYGNYTVSLTATSPFGCSNTVIRTVTIHPLPVPAFSAPPVCENLPTLLTDASTVPGGSITGWLWDLGDSGISSSQNPIHTYAGAGSYPVSLHVSSNFGCKASITDSVRVEALPTPVVTPASACANSQLVVTDVSTGPNNQIVAWDWVFDNGMFSSQSQATAVYASPGTYSVSLTTTNAAGCRAAATGVLLVNPLPEAGFTAGNGCEEESIVFQNTSTISSGSISGYTWDFGDGSGSVAQNPAHSYTTPGTYQVMLVAMSNEGCTDTVWQTVTVYPLPVANFLNINAAGCGPVVVPFTDSSWVSGGYITNWLWDFGDGNTSVDQNPVHSYTVSGTYTVTLTVTSNNGCTQTFVRNNQVTVYPSPQAEFEAEPWVANIDNPSISFVNLTSGGNAYNWTFGDGSGSTLFEPTHVYGDTGNYNVTLIAVNIYGCRDTVMHPVRIEPIFAWWIPNAFTPNNDGINDGFNVSGVSIVDVRLSIFNRWGDEIFRSEGRSNADWRGEVLNGGNELAQEGVYVYQVEVTDVWGKRHQKIGHVSLVR